MPELGEYDNFVHDKYGHCYYTVTPGSLSFIYNLYVEPKYRRQGHAKRLLSSVIKLIRESRPQGSIFIEVDPREDSIDADVLQAFYQSLGLSIFIANNQRTVN